MRNGDTVVGEVVGTAMLNLFAGTVSNVVDPARDLGSRIVRAFPPIPNQVSSTQPSEQPKG
ncbi:hypothetical protein OG440_31525 [Streptomyces sp. NBC_00637]|uniref:hypothetical protein n=1 Tax=Streptomyces sp. NBC_00637 TaxID=2903667 RepID=UPI00324F8AC6